LPEQEREARTEPPTQHRLRELRERGRVPKGADLTGAVMLLAAVMFLRLYGAVMVESLAERVVLLLSGLSSGPQSAAGVVTLMRRLIEWLLLLLIPIMGFMVGVAILSNVTQFGLVFSATPLEPDLDKMNPVNGMRRLLSLRTLVALVNSSVKIAVVGVVAFFTVRSELDAIGILAEVDAGTILFYSAGAAFRLGLGLAIALLALGVLDLLYQRYQFTQDNMMTRVEVREELKRTEGDPMIRSRRRALQRRLAMQRMLHDVPEADVVVTNPTEIAVAMKYDAERMGAPTVVAKGARAMAEKIRNIAIGNGVPILERKPLAQALFRSVDVGEEIPADLFKAVAEVLAYVYELDKMRQAG